MERNDLDIVWIDNEIKLYDGIKQALICGFFTQVAHKEGVKGMYITAKDNQLWESSGSHDAFSELSSFFLLKNRLHCIHLAVLTPNPNGFCSTNLRIRRVIIFAPLPQSNLTGGISKKNHIISWSSLLMSKFPLFYFILGYLSTLPRITMNWVRFQMVGWNVRCKTAAPTCRWWGWRSESKEGEEGTLMNFPKAMIVLFRFLASLGFCISALPDLLVSVLSIRVTRGWWKLYTVLRILLTLGKEIYQY